MSVSAISQLPFEAFEMTIAAGTGTEVPTPPYSNTWQIQVTNMNPAVGGANIFVQMQDLGIGAILPVIANPTPANSAQVRPQETAVFEIGSEGNRQQIRTRAEWLAEPGANIVLVLGVGAGNALPIVTYVQNIGGGGQIRTGNP